MSQHHISRNEKSQIWHCLVPSNFPKNLQDSSSHEIFGRMHGTLNIGKKKLITQFGYKSRDESFEPN
jgi:hypothetical protein